MNIQKLIKQFNNEDTYLIISDYPEFSKKGSKNYGIAWYTKEVLEPISREYNRRFVVLAEKGQDNRPRVYENGKILVLRVFDQKHPTLFPRILKWMISFNKIKEVHVHSEFCVNGGVKNVLLVAPFIMLIKLFGKRITYYTHNVVTDLSNIATHFNLEKNSFSFHFFSIGLKIYYYILGLIVNQFVVMDEAIKKRLSTFVPDKKIFLNPFWVTPNTTQISKKHARAKLGIKNDEFVLMYFGFVTYYKGADWIVDTVKTLQENPEFKKLRLIVAGGPAYSLKDKPYYQEYYKKLEEKVRTTKNITLTGFVEDSDIAAYFTAADVTVFPYRGLIGASASLLHAFKYHKPFLLSEHMDMILGNSEIQTILEGHNMSSEELIFRYTKHSLASKIRSLMDKKNLEKHTQITKAIAQARSKTKLLENCYTKLYAPKNTPAGTTRSPLSISFRKLYTR